MNKTYDVAVIGGGVFGAWTALEFRRARRKVVLLDAYGPSNSRASSGGESRIIRAGYGADKIYTRWAMRALERWQELFERSGQALFHRTGVLWLANERDRNLQETRATLVELGAPFEKFTHDDLLKRYPQIALDDIAWGLLEHDSGVLMARRAVQAVVAEGIKNGVEYLQSAVLTPTGKGRLDSVNTRNGELVRAEAFIFACGAWLPKIFPELLRARIFPTRQEVYFLGVPAGEARFRPPALPTWILLGDEVYGMPDLENRGLKIAFDRHGPAFDPDTGNRLATLEGRNEVGEYVARRFPLLKNAPVIETRVCQYENTSNGDFLIDRHPDFENVWLVGGGSGHGFKHGPMVGEYVAAQVLGNGLAEPRFTLATKGSIQQRAVY